MTRQWVNMLVVTVLLGIGTTAASLAVGSALGPIAQVAIIPLFILGGFCVGHAVSRRWYS